jgi:ribosomal-protein-alanine N-acetyltransferase
MTAADARTVAARRYPGEYSFYDADADADDLGELRNPAEWDHRHFAADEVPPRGLAGFLVVTLNGRVAELGLGLRPGLTGRGIGESFVGACLRFAAAALGAQGLTLAVAAFNQRAISMYEWAGFRKVERYDALHRPAYAGPCGSTAIPRCALATTITVLQNCALSARRAVDVARPQAANKRHCNCMPLVWQHGLATRANGTEMEMGREYAKWLNASIGLSYPG